MRVFATILIFSLTACPADTPDEGVEAGADTGVDAPAADSGSATDTGQAVQDSGVADAGVRDVPRFGLPDAGMGPGLDSGPVDKGISTDAGAPDPQEILFACSEFCRDGFIGFDDQGNQVDCPDDRALVFGSADLDECALACADLAAQAGPDQRWLLESCVFEHACGDRQNCTPAALAGWATGACEGICARHAACDPDRFDAPCAQGCATFLGDRGPRVGLGMAMCHERAQEDQGCFEVGGSPEELAECQCRVSGNCLNRTREQVATVTALFCRLNEACTGEPNDASCRNGYWFDHMASAPNLVEIASCLQQFDEAFDACEGDAFEQLDACLR